VQLFHLPWMFARQLWERGKVEDLAAYHALELPG